MGKKINFPPETVRIAKIVAKERHKAYIVGGCVRDSLMGNTPADWDMTTDMSPEKMLDTFEKNDLRTIPTGLKHGTVTVMLEGKPYECTTFRIDGSYHDSRRPDSVTFTKNIADDLCRRDFTVNAMAADPLSPEKEIVDLFGGISDIKSRIIRCVGEPEKRFSEDALRILRAVRFAATLGFDIEEETKKAAFKLGEKLSNISAERKSVELEKILLSDGADRGIDLLLELDLAKYIHPKIKKPDIPLKSLKAALPVRLAALFLGKDKLSLSCMKLSNELAKNTSALASDLLYSSTSAYFGDDIKANARYMAAKYHSFAEDAALLRGDTLLASVISEEKKKEPCVTISSLDLNGNDLLALGIEQKKLGKIFEKLLLEVIKDPQKNKKERLCGLALTYSDEENINKRKKNVSLQKDNEI